MKTSAQSLNVDLRLLNCLKPSAQSLLLSTCPRVEHNGKGSKYQKSPVATTVAVQWFLRHQHWVQRTRSTKYPPVRLLCADLPPTAAPVQWGGNSNWVLIRFGCYHATMVQLFLVKFCKCMQRSMIEEEETTRNQVLWSIVVNLASYHGEKITWAIFVNMEVDINWRLDA